MKRPQLSGLLLFSSWMIATRFGWNPSRSQVSMIGRSRAARARAFCDRRNTRIGQATIQATRPVLRFLRTEPRRPKRSLTKSQDLVANFDVARQIGRFHPPFAYLVSGLLFGRVVFQLLLRIHQPGGFPSDLPPQFRTIHRQAP